jgi:arabinofuranan 3-O-arabinosyltransferase
VEVHLLADKSRVSVGFDGSLKGLPLGVSEVRVPGTGGFPIRLDDVPRAMPCGSGPTVRVGGIERPTKVIASPVQLSEGLALPATWCTTGTFDLSAGSQRIVISGTDAMRPFDLLLRTAGTSAALAPPSRDVVVAAGHNANLGWSGWGEGGEARPVVVDGWMQGYRTTRADAASLSETFEPGSVYRSSLFVGAIFLLVLVLICCVPSRDGRRWPHGGVTSSGSGILSLSAAVVTAVLVGGLPGLGAAVVGVAGAWMLRRRPRVQEAVGPAAVAIAMVMAFARPWAGLDNWSGAMATPQLLALVGISAAVAAGAPRPMFFSRMTGSSTRR